MLYFLLLIKAVKTLQVASVDVLPMQMSPHPTDCCGTRVVPVKLINDLVQLPPKRLQAPPFLNRFSYSAVHSTNNGRQNITYTPQLSAQETAGININFSHSDACVRG